MSVVRTALDCPFCGAVVEVEREEPYTVRGGQACDWEPGWTNVSPTCECRDTMERLGGDPERYDDHVIKETA